MTTPVRAMSLRLRLFIVILSPLLVVTALLGIWRFGAAQDTAEELFDRGLLAAALAISRDVTISEGDALSPRSRQLISDAGGGEVFYHVTGPGGIYVTGYAYPPLPAPGQAQEDPVYSVALYRGEQVRVLRMSEPVTTTTLSGDMVVTVWQRVSDRQAFATELAIRAFGLMSVLMLTLALVVWFGVQLGLRPLRNLRAAIELRSPDDLSQIRRPVPDEVTGIVATLNRLLDQVDHSIQAHQAFISDAAHQLRNPASALLVLAETLPDVTDPTERARRERRLIEAARSSAKLTEQLLSLERLRHGAQIHSAPLELNELVQTLCVEMAPALLGRDLCFTFDPADSDLPVTADPTLIREALRNLINNAMAHGGPGLTSVSVLTGRLGKNVFVQIRDDGRGLPPEKSRDIFRRFSQLETSAGSGLGLSITQEIARLHGGTVTSDPTHKGACFTMRLPPREKD